MTEKKKDGRPRELTLEKLNKEFARYMRACAEHTEQVATAKGVVTLNKPLVPLWEHFVIVYLDMTPEALLHYEKSEGYEEFFSTIKRMKAHIYSLKVLAVQNGQGSTTGLIFDLKCNYGWKDKQEHDVNLKGDVKITMNLD